MAVPSSQSSFPQGKHEEMKHVAALGSQPHFVKDYELRS